MHQYIVHLSCYCSCKEKNSWNELSNIGTSDLISENATYHVYRIKKTRNKRDLKSRDLVPYILSVKWLSGFSEVGGHEIYQE